MRPGFVHGRRGGGDREWGRSAACSSFVLNRAMCGVRDSFCRGVFGEGRKGGRVYDGWTVRVRALLRSCLL